MKLRVSILALCLMLRLAGTASAATYCSVDGDPNTDGLSTSDVTFDGSNASDCYGIVSGNNPEDASDLNLWLAGFGGPVAYEGGGWEAVVKEDSNNVPGTVSYLGLNWTLDSEIGSNGQPDPGTWYLTLTDPPPATALPVSVDMVAVFKGGPDYVAYLFDNVTFSTLGQYDGTFVIKILVGNPNDPTKQNNPALSHMSLYLRSTDSPPPPPPPDVPVPEPASLLLLGTGLAAVAAGARRRMRK